MKKNRLTLILKNGETKESLIAYIYGDTAEGKRLLNNSTFKKIQPETTTISRKEKNATIKGKSITFSPMNKNILKAPSSITDIAAKEDWLPLYAFYLKMKRLYPSGHIWNVQGRNNIPEKMSYNTYHKRLAGLIEKGLAEKTGKGIRLISLDRLRAIYNEAGKENFEFFKNESLKEIILNLKKQCIEHNLKKQEKAIKIKSKSENVKRGEYVGKIAYVNYNPSAHKTTILTDTFSAVPNISNKGVAKMIKRRSSSTGAKYMKIFVQRGWFTKDYRYCILDEVGKRHFLSNGKVPFTKWIEKKKETVVQLSNYYTPLCEPLCSSHFFEICQ